MRSVRAWVVVALVALPLANASAQLQTFYVPLPEEEILLASQVLDPALTDTNINTVISITAAANNTIIYYDHWEDGYDLDITSPPGGSTTQIWGDANPANGAPPGIPGDIINAGTVITLANTIPSAPRVPANIFFDGRDKIGTTQLVAVTQAGWPLPGASTLMAGAIEVFSTNDWGIHYTAPGGEGFSAMFEDARFIVMAERDSTIVRVDIDNDGVDDIIQTMNQGDILRVDGVLTGTQVRSNLPIQVNFMTGDIGANFESRWFAMVPRNRWESEYIAPVGTTVVGDEASVLLYNPHATNLNVDVTTTGGTTAVVVPAGGIFRYFMPIGSGARFNAPDGRDFFAIATVDDEAQAHDWGHTLLPISSLTPAVKAGWAPGSNNPAVENSSPIWVTAEADTTLNVDWNDDGIVDLVVPILALQSIQLRDPDGDQTGTRIRTQDGTFISAAWGQDPNGASPASPALDLGTTVLPIPDIYILKNTTLSNDVDGNGLVDPGDTLTYTLFVLNTGVAAADNVTVIDTPDIYTTYVASTTSTLNLGAIPDDVPPSTPFPIDETGINIGTLVPNQSDTISYDRLIGDPLPSPQQIILNTAQVTIDTGTTSSSSEITPVTPPQFSIAKTSDVTGSALPGDIVEYTITIENTSALTQTGITVSDPLPAGTTYIAESTTVTGPGTVNTYADFFNAASYANDDGTLSWSGNWFEFADDGSPFGGDVFITNNLGANRLLVQDNTNGAGRQVDLSAETNATLSFDYRRQGLEAGKYVSIWISNNGGAGGSWTELDRFVGPTNDPGFNSVSYDISAYIANNTVIAFYSGPSPMDNSDEVLFDEVVITVGAPATIKTNQAIDPDPLLDGVPSDLVLAGDGFTLTPGSTMTVTYRVQIDNPLVPYLPAITNVVTVDSVESLAPSQATRLDPVAPGSTIGDRVWLDVDGDGVQDVGEVGLSNVRVDLIRDPDGIPGNGDDVVVGTTLTDSNGNYLFTGIYPPASGTYHVLVDATTLPVGLTPSPGNNNGLGASHVIAGNDTFVDDDFGYTAPAGTAILGDRVWSDADNDGVQDPGEVGLGGVTVNLTDLVGGIIATTTTAADGTYLFIGVVPGDYRVDVGAGIPAGYTLVSGPQSNPDPTNPITVVASDIDLTRDFGYHNPSLFSISDATWNDQDNDGVRDAGELGIAGVTVNLLDSGGNVIATTISDANGDFTFSGVVGSGGGTNYTIDITDTAGVLVSLATTTPPAAAGQLAVTVVASDVTASSFGYLTLGRIGRVIWSDSDGDGVQDPSEPGIGGVTVDLVIAGLDGIFGTADDSVFATTTTAADGSYLFDALPRGYYQTQVTDTGNVLTGATQTGDPDAVLDERGDVPLLTGATDFTMNFGYRNAAFPDVSGTVFDDTDVDGVQDTGELGLASVTIDLVAAGADGIYGTVDDLLVATTTTDANGDYSFVDVAAGNYRSVVTDLGNVLNGYTLTSGLDQIDVSVVATDITGVDFGYVRVPGTGSIGDSVWLDANRDGVENPSENGIANARVNLYSAGPDRVIGGGDDVLIATEITDLFGNYMFTGLPAGDYYVDVVDATIPAGLALTGTATDPTGLIALSGGGTYVSADFGYASAVGVAIGDTVFYDANGDGIQNPGEVGIGGVSVTVNFGTGSTTVVTAADGTWLVTGLPAGNASVAVDPLTLPAGFNTTPTNGPLTRGYVLAAGLDWLRADFGFDAPAGVSASVGDTVFFDADGDGAQDPGETGISGVTIRILDAGGNVVGTDITDASGNYDFLGLIPGDYRVEVTDIAAVLAGLNLSAGVNPTAAISVAGGDNVDTADFGYTASGGAGSIGSFVWHDTDGSGTVSGAEASLGLQGITIDLYLDVNGNGTLDPGIDNRVRTTVTSITGDYEFNGLPGADYLVDVTDTSGVLAGFTKTNGAAGVDNNSQADPYAITLAAGSTNFTGDFGYRAAGTNQLSGITFFDIAGNGIFDGLDNGVRDVSVYLYRDLDGDGVLDVGDPRIGFQLAGAAGNYLFDNMPDGNFIVAVDVSGTFLSSSFQTTQTATAGVEPVALLGAHSTGNNFGFNIAATLVTITRFEVYQDGGQAVVEWTTGSEVGSLGFYVFRRDPATDGWIQVNDKMLPALNAPQGAQYRLIDDGAPARPAKLTYVIYEAEEGGGERRYGPFTTRISPARRAAPMQDRFEARARRRPQAMQARMERARERREAARTRRTTTRQRRRGQAESVVKLTVDAAGVYFVDSASIATALQKTEARIQRRIASGRLNLSTQGEDVAWLPASGHSGRAGLYFYGEKLDSLYTADNVYWLSLGTGTTMESLDSGPQFGNADDYLHHEHLEVDAFGATVASPDPDADIWYWSSLIAGWAGADRGTYTFEASEVAALATGGVVEIATFGATATPHHLVVRLNGATLGEDTWTDIGAHDVRVDLDTSLLVEGTNTIEVEAVLDPGVAFDVVYIDELDVAYAAQARAEIVVVESVETVLDRVVVSFEGSLVESRGTSVRAFVLDRTFRHFGHNAPTKTTSVSSGVVSQSNTAFVRVIDQDGSSTNVLYSSLASGEMPLDQEVDDLASGNAFVCQGVVKSFYDDNTATWESYEPFTVVRTVEDVRPVSLTWGHVSGSATVVTLDQNLVPNEDFLYQLADLRQLAFHEVVGPQLRLRATTTWSTGSFSDGLVGFYGTLEQVRALAGRLLLLADEAGRTQSVTVMDEPTDFDVADAERPWMWTVTLSEEPQWCQEDFDESEPAIVAYGNVLGATQGETQDEAVLGSGDHRRVFQTFSLPKAPLTYLLDPSRTPAERPELEVRVGRVLWEQVESFFDRGAEEQIYVVREDEDGNSWVQFGDGIHGARLPSGRDNVTAVFRTGVGAAGPLEEGGQPKPTARVEGVDEVLMPVPAVGGEAAETEDTAKVAAPGRMQSLGRLVGLADYEAEALEIPGVLRASARWAAPQGVPLIELTVLTDSGDAADLDHVRDTMATYNRCRGPARFPIRVFGGVREYVYLELDVAYSITRTSEDVTDDIRRVLGVEGESDEGLFGVHSAGFGQNVHISQVVGAVQQVDGVVWVDAIGSEVLGSAPPAAPDPCAPDLPTDAHPSLLEASSPVVEHALLRSTARGVLCLFGDHLVLNLAMDRVETECAS